jgi:hypothetical protein
MEGRHGAAVTEQRFRLLLCGGVALAFAALAAIHLVSTRSRR